MLPARWWLYVLSGTAQLEVYRRVASGTLQARDVEKSLLDAISLERLGELGRWPEHQVDGTRPRPATNPLVLRALARMAQRYLVWQGGAIGFAPAHLLEWREQVGHRLDPDLLVIAAAALDVFVDDPIVQPRLLDDRRLEHITGAPLLPPVALTEVQALAAEGLTEVHRHLSLACLPGLVWTAALAERDLKLRELPPAPYRTWSQLMRHALAIRRALLAYLTGSDCDAASLRNAQAPPAELLTEDAERPVRAENDDALSLAGARVGATSRERALLIHLLQRVTKDRGPPELGWLLHSYLLLRGITVGAIIQPADGRKGLDRFKNHYVDSGWHGLVTDSPRVGVEQALRTGRVHWLEGKVAPKKRVAAHLGGLLPRAVEPSRTGKFAPLMDRLLDGQTPDYDGLFSPERTAANPAIRLVMHFLREPDNETPTSGIRRVAFAGLRERVHEQALTILSDLSDPEVGRFVVGLDVASLEMSAPVEVFAPVLRSLRSPWQAPPALLPGRPRSRSHDLGLSVHAGEEFRHLAEGIRRVVETVDFCGFRAGDRLGHALSIGLEPKMWAERWGGVAAVPCQVRLDDLVWMWCALDAIPRHVALRTRLKTEARRIFREIYGREMPPMDILAEAWRLRAEDPLAHELSPAGGYAVMGPLREQMARSLRRALAQTSMEAQSLWWEALTDPGVLRRGAEIGEVSLQEDELEALRDLQDLVLWRLEKERIAIEINPSSNLAISCIATIGEHPVFRWVPLDDVSNTPRPTVVVGSDDPAIFGSELVHEYALLALAAERRGAVPRAVARWLSELKRDSDAARFVGGFG